jgi:hypothetical protein
MIKWGSIAFLFFFSIISTPLFAQDSTKASPFSYSGYVDAYYAYYTDSVGTGNIQKFPTISPRSNAMGLNIAMLSVHYASEKVRSTMTLHYGDIALTTWSAKYNFIQEANVGIRLHKKLWLDAGLFRTHIGTEGLLPKENICSSVAIGTFNEPYYQAGFKLMYSPSDKLSLCLHILNGYNMFEDNNASKSLGMLAGYIFNDNFSMGYSNYIGDDVPNDYTNTHIRFFHNLYINYSKNKIRIQVGGDYCTQMNSDTTATKSSTMYSGLASFRFQATSKLGIYTRGEIINDNSGFLTGSFIDNTNKTTGLKLWGVTMGAEYKPTDNSYIRVEARQLQCDPHQQIFHWEGKNQSSRLEAMFHMGVYF